MSDDGRMERLLADALIEAAPPRAPHHLKDQIRTDTRQMRPRPRWLALTKEPPMRISSSLAVGSPTARLVAVLAATLLLALGAIGAGIAGNQLLAANAPIVVAADGSGDFATLSEAVAASVDGDSVLVRPGTYTEAVVVDKDITIKGDGDRADIVIVAPDDGPTAPIVPSDPFSAEEDPYAILLLDTAATLSDLTFRGERSIVFASGGSPMLERLTFEDTALPYRGGTGAQGNSIVLNGGTAATVRDSELIGGGPIGIFDLSPVLIDSNRLIDGPHIWGGGDATVIRGNTIERPFVRGIGVFDPATVLIEGNTIVGAGQMGIDIWADSPTLRGNRIEGSGFFGVNIQAAADVIVAENELVDNGTAISWSGTTGSIEDNTISGGTAGLSIAAGAPLVSGNTVTGVAKRGIVAGVGTSPTLRENDVCDNGENVVILTGATPDIDDSNEICGGITAP